EVREMARDISHELLQYINDVEASMIDGGD
ncbi:hypothetical protein, partial [Bacillus spizizenii]